MTEQARIQALLEAGKITQQEADLLLSALEEGEAAAQQAQAVIGEQYASSGAAGWQPEGLRWVRLKLTAGQLEARLDPAIELPVLEGPAEVRRVGADLEIVPETMNAGFLNGLLGRMGRLELRLPPGWGLEVEGKAAQVEARGIDFLKGRVAVGNVELEAVKGLDLEVTAGNIEGSLLLQEGTHQLRVSMGNAELNLLPGSSVRLSASVSLGNQEIRGLERNPNGGDRQIGEGRARLEVSVRMGNLEIKAR
ncbi:hypothetical protein [Meiothermus ruber]|uniref:Uncharacterized protein n=1 Tax=Meiothermus ruber (strain ATCC 35948 / DSM 1279 / VKM B-1258 / 21) TaxID=504728 RepID=D3PR93_MEIRD|nr:hypothetical protein [Meiothermus ruber]ADD27976.1 hypothetical protein Mrub_1213 [Meiothermus ruber DSM 1279]AGK04445.1 hypothetical protein K649_05715 [Meiothermus ruber DSM 1279]MCL6530307.1 hypothetical protein [Meiothermus ruber]